MSQRHVNEDQALRESYDRGEWRPVKGLRRAAGRYAAAARRTLRKTARMNIRISEADLEGLQAKAAQEGLPYQTLVASVLHKYVSGQLAARG